MKTVVILVIVLVIVLVVVVALVVTGVGVFGKRQYQTYKGLERQRGAAREARTAGVSRLDTANQRLVRAQRSLVDRGASGEAKQIEQLRRRLATAADRHRYASSGYAPVGSDRPVQEGELGELQVRDADIITHSDRIVTLSEQVETEATSSDADGVDLRPLSAAIDDLTSALDARKAFIR